MQVPIAVCNIYKCKCEYQNVKKKIHNRIALLYCKCIEYISILLINEIGISKYYQKNETTKNKIMLTQPHANDIIVKYVILFKKI